MDIHSVNDPATAERQRHREHPRGYCSSPTSSPGHTTPQYMTTQPQKQQDKASSGRSSDREPESPSSSSLSPPSSTSQEAVEDSSLPPLCSVITWGNTAVEDDEAQQQNAADCSRRPLVTSDDLRNEISSLVHQREVPLAAAAAGAATSSSFINTTGFEQEQQQQKQHDAQRKPLIILHGLPELFLSALVDSPLDIDPVFIEAHAEGRRYRPRGVHRRRGGRASHWDFPELVSGYSEALRQQQQQRRRFQPGREVRLPGQKQHKQHKQQLAARPVSGVGGDLAAVFCRASLWSAEGVDVLFLDDDSAWRRLPGSSTPWQARGRSDAARAGCALVGREGASRGEVGGRWQAVLPEKGEDRTSLEDTLQEAVGASDVDGGALEDVLEEAAYDRWLEFFEVLTPRREVTRSGRMLLEWQVMEALERNTDMRGDIVRRRRRSPSTGPCPDWEALTRRLQLRVDMLSTMPPQPKAPTAQPGRDVPIHENNLALLPIARRPVPTDDGGDPSSGANENQHALDRVTYLGGILLPFSIVSGVLSMNEDFEPGHTLFWVFWVVAVPLSVMTILVIYADKLRRVEEYVWDPVVEENPVVEEDSYVMEESPMVGGEYVAEESGLGLRLEVDPRVSTPGGRMHFAQPEAVRYNSETGEVVIDLGTPTTATGDQEMPALSPSRVCAGFPTPGGDQDQSAHQPDEEEEDSSAGEDVGVHTPRPSHPPRQTPPPSPMPILPSTNPIPTALGERESVVDSSNQHHHRRRRHRKLRKQQLGWAGAVLCMLHLRKPSLVSDGVPVGATGGPRRRVETERSDL